LDCGSSQLVWEGGLNLPELKIVLVWSIHPEIDKASYWPSWTPCTIFNCSIDPEIAVASFRCTSCHYPLNTSPAYSVEIDGLPMPSEGWNSTTHPWVADWAHGRRDLYGPMAWYIPVSPVAQDGLSVMVPQGIMTGQSMYGGPVWWHQQQILQHQQPGLHTHLLAHMYGTTIWLHHSTSSLDLTCHPSIHIQNI